MYAMWHWGDKKAPNLALGSNHWAQGPGAARSPEVAARRGRIGVRAANSLKVSPDLDRLCMHNRALRGGWPRSEEDHSMTGSAGAGDAADRLDTSVAHSARVGTYLLGGKYTFGADRETGDLIFKMFPGIAQLARLQRQFLAKAVRYLAAEAGIRQFLDVGTGLPTADHTHEVAQAVAPESKIVYVDNDPLVLVHAQALLTSAPGGVTAYIEADVRDPDKILREAARTLDFSQPVE